MLRNGAELFGTITSGSRGWAEYYAPVGARFIRVQNVQRGHIHLDLSDVQHVRPPAGAEGQRTRLRPGDVVITITADLGRVGLVPDDIGEAYVNQHVALARPRDGAMSRYLAWFLASADAQEQLGLLDRGATRAGLGLKDLAGLRIPVPPLAEQHRIVARVEALFARTCQARADLLRVAPLAEKSRAAILAAAFRGDLTRDLRHSIDVGEAHGPWPIPNAWSWRRVDDVGRVSLGRQRSPANHTGPFMRPYVRAANITWSGWDFSDLKEMNFAEPDFSRFRLVPGDVLLNEGSGSAREVGKPAIWRGEIPDCCFQNTLLRVQPRGCTAEYLYYYFLDAALSGRFADETQGVNIHHIGKEGLAALPIPVPPHDEQTAIAHRLKDALAQLSRAERDATRSLALLDHLERSLLSRAFCGELVPQDPDEEPASVALERIQSKTETSGKKPRTRRTPISNKSEGGSMTGKTLLPRDWLLQDCEKWPAAGLPFETIATRIPISHDVLRDALFDLLSGPLPALKQRFDADAEMMLIQRVTA